MTAILLFAVAAGAVYALAWLADRSVRRMVRGVEWGVAWCLAWRQRRAYERQRASGAECAR